MKITLTDKYISGCDINLEKRTLGVLHQPRIKYLIEKDISIDIITNVFSLTEHTHWKLSRDIFTETVPSKFMIALTVDQELTQKYGYSPLLITLSVLYGTGIENISLEQFNEELVIFIKDKKVIIDENNFEILLTVVLGMFYIEKEKLHRKLTEEDNWVELSGSEREKEMIAFFKQREKEKREKETLHLNDYINMVTHLGNYTYDYVLSLTYWQLMNTLRALQGIEVYKERLGYTWSSKFDIERDEDSHWKKQIKLTQETIEI